jgi:hypothetical protein
MGRGQVLGGVDRPQWTKQNKEKKLVKQQVKVDQRDQIEYTSVPYRQPVHLIALL